ncbi:hypothetical protein [Pantoea sp. Z09]|uniref:hypothetical protein n=1 Tax=Pantoea sp. Z09 TaxID=2886821 RepID=UPI001EFCC059|nr:hypothetical protein [Pantoea sp. Z09]
MSLQLESNINGDNPGIPELTAFIQRNIPKIAQPLAGICNGIHPTRSYFLRVLK